MRSAYNRGQMDFGLKCGPSQCVKADPMETDINAIVKRAMRTGYLTDPAVPGRRQPMFGDFSRGGDFEAAQTAVAQAKSDFMSLPAAVREYFDNDVGNLLAVIDDPAMDDTTRSILVEAGVEALRKPEPVVVPDVVKAPVE